MSGSPLFDTSHAFQHPLRFLARVPRFLRILVRRRIERAVRESGLTS